MLRCLQMSVAAADAVASSEDVRQMVLSSVKRTFDVFSASYEKSTAAAPDFLPTYVARALKRAAPWLPLSLVCARRAVVRATAWPDRAPPA
jgi:hypothetical protein